MFFQTKLSRYLADILRNFKEKVFIVQSSLSLVLFSLFTGFLFGNLFGTFLDKLRLYFSWSGFVGLLVLLLIETINSLVYGISRNECGKTNFLEKKPFPLRSREYSSQEYSMSLKSQIFKISNIAAFTNSLLANLSLFKQNLLLFSLHNKIPFFSKETIHMKRMINSFKIGLLFGFFVDSFKVGS